MLLYSLDTQRKLDFRIRKYSVNCYFGLDKNTEKLFIFIFMIDEKVSVKFDIFFDAC